MGQNRGYLGKVTSDAMQLVFRAQDGSRRVRLDDTTNGGLLTHFGDRYTRISSEGATWCGSDNLIHTKITSETGRIENWNRTGGGVWLYNLADTTRSANVVSGPDWKILRATSLRKHKADIRPLDVNPYAILDVSASTWLDKGELAQIEDSRLVAKAEADGAKIIDPNWKPFPESVPRRIPGFIAEDMESAGLGILCQYDGDGELTGIQYDRVPAAIALAVKALLGRVEDLESLLSTITKEPSYGN
ncbi:hypothetical protein [Leucobacter sp. G161]|uniref:hypothetical protein n=1 Tax=Leucobacter sp. G161 TaxID=663704 RepID=UPI00073C1DDC|nr:hypothetical protein [Leucobacter sp. G161]KUF05524.1 hypothetical protein AUL38_04000 [Leucobacter sp. G161]